MKVQQEKLYSGVAAAAMLCALDGVASAADLPAKAAAPVAQPVIAAPNWTGFYLGGHVGYGWSKVEGEESGTAVEHGGPRPKGWLLGVHGGYNYQINQILLGVEGNWTGGLNFDDKACTAGGCGTDWVRADIHWLGSVRGRLGWVFNDRLVLFGTAGAGWRSVTVEAYSGTSHTPRKTTVSGGVWGGGLDYKLMQNVSLRLQALRYLGSKNITLGSDTGDGVGRIKPVTTVDLGLTWHF